MREKILAIIEKNSRIDLAGKARPRWPMRLRIWKKKILSAATIR